MDALSRMADNLPEVRKDEEQVKYTAIEWWPGAFHVIKEGKRVGIVNHHTVRENGRDKEIWFAHNKLFFSVGGKFPSRAKAAATLSTKPIRHDSNAFK